MHSIDLVSTITDIMSYCHSKRGKSPLDMAKEKGHTAIVSMMTRALECESKELSAKIFVNFFHALVNSSLCL